MKKSFIFLILLSLFSFNLTAQGIENNDKSLLGQIQKIELKKKEAIDIHNNIIETRNNTVKNTIRKITDKKIEIFNSPYRTAELLEDGVTPSEFALKRREDNYNEEKNQIIENDSKELKENENILLNKISLLLKEINKDYELLKLKTLSTEGDELTITYSSYDAENIGWNFNIILKYEDTVVEKTGLLTLEELTGKDPVTYSEEDFDNFCKDVEYYDDLFFKGVSEFIFKLECGAYPLDIEHPSQYNIKFNSLTYNNGTKTGNLILNDSDFIISMADSYDLQPVLEKLPESYTVMKNKVEAARLASMGFYFSPIYLPEGTDGSLGTKGTYVLFGYWPQTVKSDEVTVNSFVTEDINGWICYKGSDNCYYVKSEAEPYNDVLKFSNGTAVTKGTEYYFKLEPIKWRVMTDDYQGNILLCSENVLLNRCFYPKKLRRTVQKKKVYSNNYKYSEIRAYLNGLDGSDYYVDNFKDNGFINRAFTSEAIEQINAVLVDNSPLSTTDSDNNIRQADYYTDYTCDDTEDKIFLLSEKEVTEKNYGFSYYNKTESNERRKKATDYSIAIGAVVSDDYEGNCFWWLRSPYYDANDKVLIVSAAGMANDKYVVNKTDAGIVPALSISPDIFPVSEISNLKFTTAGTDILFSWTNPDEDDFEKVIISAKDIDNIEVKGEKGVSLEKLVTGLKKGENYTITLKTVTKSGALSEGVTIDVFMNNLPPAEVLNAKVEE